MNNYFKLQNHVTCNMMNAPNALANSLVILYLDPLLLASCYHNGWRLSTCVCGPLQHEWATTSRTNSMCLHSIHLSIHMPKAQWFSPSTTIAKSLITITHWLLIFKCCISIIYTGSKVLTASISIEDLWYQSFLFNDPQSSSIIWSQFSPPLLLLLSFSLLESSDGVLHLCKFHCQY